MSKGAVAKFYKRKNHFWKYFSWLRKLLLRVEGHPEGLPSFIGQRLHPAILRKEGSLPRHHPLHLPQGVAETQRKTHCPLRVQTQELQRLFLSQKINFKQMGKSTQESNQASKPIADCSARRSVGRFIPPRQHHRQKNESPSGRLQNIQGHRRHQRQGVPGVQTQNRCWNLQTINQQDLVSGVRRWFLVLHLKEKEEELTITCTINLFHIIQINYDSHLRYGRTTFSLRFSRSTLSLKETTFG